jgi:hypothetical protein
MPGPAVRPKVKFSLHSPLVAAAILLCLTAPAAAQDVGARDPARAADAAPGGRNQLFAVRRANAEMRIDARLDEPDWATAETIPLPIEITPGDNIAASIETQCRVTFDDRNVYLGCIAHDPDPAGIRATVTDRDGIYGNHDRISFLLDPFNDSRRGFVFEVSAVGVQGDLVYDERTSSFDESWDGIWESAGRITDSGYVIEAAIPFRTLRFPNTRDVQTWRFWINRMRPRSEFVVMRTNTRHRDESCQLCQAHLLRGFAGMNPGVNVELVPTLTGRRSESRATDFPDGPLSSGGTELEPGLDARWSVTTNLALNATINPDFSQVEADAPQLDANNSFALRFPEKRPFFLEGADLFDTPIDAVFTRSIVDPSAGVKLTGKQGPHAAGALIAVDERNALLFPGPFGSAEASLDERVTSALLRYRRDLGEHNTVGVIYTGRFGTEAYRNQVAGLDLFLRPAASLTVNAQALVSQSRYGDSIATVFDQPHDAFAGQAASTRVTYRTRQWRSEVGTELRTADFRADAGFVPQTGYRDTWINGSHTLWGSGGLLTRLESTLGAWHTAQTGGGLVSEGAWVNFYYEGPLQSSAWLNPMRAREWFGGEAHEIFGVWTGLNVRPRSWLRLGFSGNTGDQIDFRNGGVGHVLRLSPSVDLQIGRNAEAGIRQSFQDFEKDGEQLFTATVGELRGVYHLNARTFVRAIVQHRRTERNPATNPGLVRPLDEALFGQFLFSYKVNPLTVIFLGMTDDRVGYLENGHERVDLTQRGRTLFFKLGYAWRP